MASSKTPHLLEVLVEETESGLLVKSANSADKATRNGYKTVVVDINNIYANGSCTAINPSLIVSLNLSQCDLNDFPDVFKTLHLKSLNLSCNKLREVPDCILGGLRFLERLDLSHNVLQTFEQPKCVKSLRVLKINNNSLMNIPEWILHMNAFNLEEFCYSFNEIESLKKCRFLTTPSYRLTKIELRNCRVRVHDIKFIKQIRTLRSLDLSNEGYVKLNCFANYDSFFTLFDKPSWHDWLKILHLNNLGLSSLPDDISQLVVLEELYLSKNELTWLPDTLVSINTLRILDLSRNQIAFLPNGIHNMKDLKVLEAAHNHISRIPSFTNLTILDLYNNYLDTNCDIKKDCKIFKMDFEQNFFDTANWNHKDYIDKKNALRESKVDVIIRIDGPRRVEYDEEDLPSPELSNYSEYESSDDGAVAVVDYKAYEEDWSTDYKSEHCDNGCTLSDNEWMGREPVRFVRKKVKQKLKKYPSWTFEDVST